MAAGDRDFTLSFEYDVTAADIVCTSVQSSRALTLLQAQTYRALTIARRLTFDAPLPWTSSSLYEWLVASIRGIRFRGDISSSSCCNPANTINILATVGPNNSGLGVIVKPTDIQAIVGLVVLFVHEARHNNGFPHSCPDRIKDKTIAELGAWGVQYNLDMLLATHSVPTFILTGERSLFSQAATQVCSNELCEDRCP